MFTSISVIFQQSLIELAKWHKSFVQSAPGAAEVQSPHAEEVILSTLDYLETFFESKKSCMIGPVVAELARYLSAQISLRDRLVFKLTSFVVQDDKSNLFLYLAHQ
jgi:oligoribonuclease (3'-5' exoribonuclease)